MSINKIELDIIALSHSVSQQHNYAIVLGEKGGTRRLPIVIGGFEAQAIAVAMERMTPNRPLTHDLLKNTLETFDIDLQEVVISKLLDGVFYANLVCLRNGEVVEIDSRTSDALAMAVRFNCPIYTYENILETAGVVMEDTESENEPQYERAPVRSNAETLTSLSITELNKMLGEVLDQEDYERAAKIRDEINRREQQS